MSEQNDVFRTHRQTETEMMMRIGIRNREFIYLFMRRLPDVDQNDTLLHVSRTIQFGNIIIVARPLTFLLDLHTVN